MDSGEEMFDGNGVPPANKGTIRVEKNSDVQEYGSKVSSDVVTSLNVVSINRRDSSSNEENDQVIGDVPDEIEAAGTKTEQKNIQLEAATEAMVSVVDEVSKKLDTLTDSLDSKISEITTLSNGDSEYALNLTEKVAEIKNQFSSLRTDSESMETLLKMDNLGSRKSEVVAISNQVINVANQLFGSEKMVGTLRELAEFASEKRGNMQTMVAEAREVSDVMARKGRVYEDIDSQLRSDVDGIRFAIEQRFHPTMAQILTAIG